GAGVGLLLLGAGTSPWLLGCYVVLYGYAMGGNATLVASLIGEVFGRLHYGAISGRMTPFLVGAQAIGVPLAVLVRDRRGSLASALVAAVAGSLVAAGVVLGVRVPHRVRIPTPRTDLVDQTG